MLESIIDVLSQLRFLTNSDTLDSKEPVKLVLRFQQHGTRKEKPMMNSPHTDEATIFELIEKRYTRRDTLKGLTAGLTGFLLASQTEKANAAGNVTSPSTLTFQEVSHQYKETLETAKGYKAQIVMRWGDPVTTNAPEFQVDQQTSQAQLQQFGYNNDFVAFMPLPVHSANSEHGLLCVNHEYTRPHLMFPNISAKKKEKFRDMTEEQVKIEMAAHGHSITEIKKIDGKWQRVSQSKYHRRITALKTVMNVSGPAAGSDRLKTSNDPTGRKVIGTLNNCAGGVTPWGTVLFAEENFHLYFSGDPISTNEKENHLRYGLANGVADYCWNKFAKRFDVNKEPNEPNRFGWVVEYDPYNPSSVPVKRTSLGRFRHEGATTALTPDGRVVVYSGDDDKFEYLYKFVSSKPVNTKDRSKNWGLLDDGILYAARFHADGQLQWLPLVYGKGRLKSKYGFYSQADVLIETRRAADLMGATPLDRPEDVETNPLTGRVYVMLTNNTNRSETELEPACPRPSNRHGHILELIPPRTSGVVDHGALWGHWELFLKGGNPSLAEDDAYYHSAVTEHGWLSCPDNCTFDNQGRLWIATDGFPGTSGKQVSDAIFACDTIGPGRALTRCFFQGPRGAEICGPAFTPDNKTLFVAIQHPGDESGSTFANPSTRWPDFDKKLPPRPSVIAITHSREEPIGS